MKYAVAAAALVAAVSAQSSGSCLDTVPYKFEFTPVNVSLSVGTAKRDTLERRVAECNKKPVVNMTNGILHDQDNRQGEIVHNTQFQFDDQLQADRISDSGWCINSNNTLSVGGSAIFYSCISGDFSNVYTTDIGSVCSQVYLQVIQCVGGIASGSASLSSTTTSKTGSSTAASTPSSTPSSSVVTTPVNTPTVAPAPYPVGNSTTRAATASASGSPTTTAGTSSTSPATFQPSNGASVLAMGSQLIAGVAAIGAFALF